MSSNIVLASEEAKQGFYPTPPRVVEKLVKGIQFWDIGTILEPSAGKGNIILGMAEIYKRTPSRWHERHINVDAIEYDPYLRSILHYELCGKRKDELFARKRQLEAKERYDPATGRVRLTGADKDELVETERQIDLRKIIACNIVHDDFLTFGSRKQYDLIVMNPPFSNGDEHLLKAIQMQEVYGGQIRCILNAETILNPYTHRRQVLKQKLAQYNAEVSFEDDSFSDAERSTDVGIAIIKIKIPAPYRRSTIFDRIQKAAKVEEAPDVDVTDMVVDDFLKQIVQRYNVELDVGISLIQEVRATQPYILNTFNTDGTSSGGQLSLHCGKEPATVNNFIRSVRAKYWTALFDNKEFMGKLTQNLRDKYRGMVNELVSYDFSMFNIQQIAAQMNAEMAGGIQDTILSLFERMTVQHTWFPECAGNVHYFNGWKTNKAHKVNKKVILPVNGMFSDYYWEKKGAININNAESTISDIEKVFDYLDGNMTANVDLHGVLEEAHNAGKNRGIKCKYFTVDLFKKGTMHIKFTNPDILDRFNIYCAKKRTWLPPNYGKAAYKNMTEEEKAVVDGFNGTGESGSGEEAYEAVMQRSDFFLAEPTGGSSMLAIAAPAALEGGN